MFLVHRKALTRLLASGRTDAVCPSYINARTTNCAQKAMRFSRYILSHAASCACAQEGSERAGELLDEVTRCGQWAGIAKVPTSLAASRPATTSELVTPVAPGDERGFYASAVLLQQGGGGSQPQLPQMLQPPASPQMKGPGNSSTALPSSALWASLQSSPHKNGGAHENEPLCRY